MEEKFTCPFGEALKKAMKKHGFNQSRLARAAKKDKRHIRSLLSNDREPRLSTILILARAMNIDAGELVREVDALIPAEWAKPDPEDLVPKKAGRPKKKKEAE